MVSYTSTNGMLQTNNKSHFCKVALGIMSLYIKLTNHPVYPLTQFNKQIIKFAGHGSFILLSFQERIAQFFLFLYEPVPSESKYSDSYKFLYPYLSSKDTCTVSNVTNKMTFKCTSKYQIA